MQLNNNYNTTKVYIAWCLWIKHYCCFWKSQTILLYNSKQNQRNNNIINIRKSTKIYKSIVPIMLTSNDRL